MEKSLESSTVAFVFLLTWLTLLTPVLCAHVRMYNHEEFETGTEKNCDPASDLEAPHTTMLRTFVLRVRKGREHLESSLGTIAYPYLFTDCPFAFRRERDSALCCWMLRMKC